MTTPVSSITGLSSGIDTNKIVTQLMTLEQAPLTRMQTSITDYQSKVAAWTAVRTKLSVLQSAAAALTNA